MSPRTYDLIVLGSGPAGEKGAAQAAYFGKSVALIEKQPPPVYGGAAANTGTLPSKTLRETALFLSGFRNRQLEGLEFRWKDAVNIDRLMARRKAVVSTEQKRILTNMNRHGVDLFEGLASFAGPHTIAVRRKGAPETLLRGEVILIATGSAPYRPPAFRVEDPRIVDSDSILNIEAIPKELVVVGGGVIGCEYACMFAIMGSHVTLIEKQERVLTFMDEEISDAMLVEMKRLGVTFFLGDAVDRAELGPSISLQLQSGAMLHPDLILISSGRSGNTGLLGLERLGVEIDDRGRINVDSTFQTSVPYVYAAGDVIKGPGLASTAMEQGRIAMIHAFQLEFARDLSALLPSGIYTIPECSMVGPTERDLLAQGIPYVVGKATYEANARGQIIGDTSGFLKLIFHEESLKLLSVHVIGEAATELVHIGLTALHAEAGADLFVRACYNYPTLSETYKYATYDALGRRTRKRAGQPS
jgi:NAD(P) transhydrogenase